MRLFLLTILLVINTAIKPQIIVGYYYGNYSGYPYNFIDYNCITHIAHAFIIPDSNGTFSYPEWFLYPDLIKAAHENGIKIIVSIGGWGGSEGFKPMAADTAKRSRFIKELVSFVKINGYDGADLDWEYPKAPDRENYTSLITEMRNAFDKAGIEILSAALPAMDWNNVFDIAVLKEKFTWFGIMTYDFYGPWEKITGHNTALYSTNRQRLSVDASINHYLKKGVPANKLCMGMEFSGYQFNADSLYKFHKGGKSISYINSLARVQEGWSRHWDNNAKVPYYFLNDSIITIDDSSSIRYKTDYIIEQDIAGTIIWKLGLDYINQTSVLINQIADRLFSVRPGKCEIEFPENYSLIDILNADIKWKRAKGAGKYFIQISEMADFSNIAYEKSVGSEFVRPDLNPFRIYYCRVRGETVEEKSEWSDTITFSTYNSASLLSGEDIFFFFQGQNGKETCLFYRLKKPGSLKIILKNIYGETKLFIDTETSEVPSHSRMDLSGIPEGEYEFRIIYERGNHRLKIKI